MDYIKVSIFKPGFINYEDTKDKFI